MQSCQTGASLKSPPGPLRETDSSRTPIRCNGPIMTEDVEDLSGQGRFFEEALSEELLFSRKQKSFGSNHR